MFSYKKGLVLNKEDPCDSTCKIQQESKDLFCLRRQLSAARTLINWFYQINAEVLLIYKRKCKSWEHMVSKIKNK